MTDSPVYHYEADLAKIAAIWNANLKEEIAVILQS